MRTSTAAPSIDQVSHVDNVQGSPPSKDNTEPRPIALSAGLVRLRWWPCFWREDNRDMESSANFADQLADAARSMQGWSSTQLTLESVVLVATEIIQGCDLVGISDRS